MMKRRFFPSFQSKTAQSSDDCHYSVPASLPTPPKPPPSIRNFFAKHHSRSETMVLRKTQQPLSAAAEVSRGDSFDRSTNPSSSGISIFNRHKTTTATTSTGVNKFPPPLASSSSSLDANEFDFQTYYQTASTSSPLLATESNDNWNMLKQLYPCDQDENLYHHVPLKPSHLSSPQPPSPQPQQQQQQQPRWTVGKISVLILACLSLTDIVFHMVDAQMESLEAPDHYDALSADVIRPAFRYHSHYNNEHQRRSNHHHRPTMGLGSAAISSVTTALSPILPFTGGIDLRREDYWTNGWWGSVSSVMEQVREAFDGATSSTDASDAMNTVLETPRGGAAVTHTKKNKKNTHSKQHFVLSGSEPFAPIKEIAELTLHDVAMSFRFAVENTRRDFQPSKFFVGLLPRAKKVVDRMSTAVMTARGKGVAAPFTGDQESPVPSGDVNALSFCAAMRIFAEWRVLRQVPPGYKGYAVGMTLGHKDVVQNIAKLEQAIHSFVDHRLATNSDGVDNVSSPTLRELLQYEIDADIQDIAKLPQLKEKSAAMGLLWVRRQLQYQTAIFANVMKMPERFESTRAAVQSAYDEVYNSYHGWAVQKIFSYSFQAAPDASEIYKYMDLHRLSEVQREAQHRFLAAGVNQHSLLRQPGEGSSDHPLERFGRHVAKEWDKFAGNVVQEWDKLINGVGQLFGQRSDPVPVMVTTTISPLTTITSAEMSSPIASPETDRMTADITTSPSELDIENYINQEMEKNAYEHIRSYLEVVTPILHDLESLFDEFNMNDPTKV